MDTNNRNPPQEILGRTSKNHIQGGKIRGNESEEIHFKTSELPREGFKNENRDKNQDLLARKTQRPELEKTSFIENFKQYLPASGNSCTLKGNLKRPLNQLQHSLKDLDTPIDFLNFRRDPEDDNMPIILNTFSLSKMPSSLQVEKQEANIVGSTYNFPVTSPCLPSIVPRLFASKLARTQSGHYSARMPFAFSRSPTKAARTDASTAGTTDDNKVHSQCEIQQKNCKFHDEVFYDASKIPPSQSQAKDCELEQQSKVLVKFKSQDEQLRFEKNSLFENCEILKPRQNIKQDHLPTNQMFDGKDMETNDEASRITNMAVRNEVSEFPYTNLEAPLEENGGEYSVRLETSFDATMSDRPIENVGVNTKDESDCHVFMSPRDAKVVQLKQKLKVQEMVLKKLRRNNGLS